MENKAIPSRKQACYDYLLGKIISAELNQEDPIVEQDICKELNVSRTPVREAIKQLEAEGLVWSSPSRGTFVKEVTIQDLEEIFELREAFELISLRTAINIISNEKLEEFEAMLLDLQTSKSQDLFLETDRMLHEAIVTNGRNQRLCDFLKLINVQIEQFRKISAHRPNRLMNSVKEHLKIVRAIKTRDLAEAERVLKEHILNVKLSTLDELMNKKYAKKSDFNIFYKE